MKDHNKCSLNHFEPSLQELENIVGKMESGNINLDEALSLFERGINITKKCQEILAETETKLSLLLQAETKTNALS